MTLAIAKGLVLPEGSRFSIGAVPAAIAGVAPTLDYRPALERREIEAVSLSDKLTFFGGNQGTFVGSDGYIQRAQTDEARFDHNPTIGESLGLLVEEQRSNLLPSSVYTSNANGWTNGVIGGTGTIASAVVTNKAGNTNGVFGVSGLNGTSYVGCFASTVSSTNTYTASVFVKNNGGTVFQMRLVNQNGGTYKSSATQYTFATGAWADGIAGTAAPVSRTVQDMGDGWLRFSITAADNDTGNTQTALLLFGGTTTTNYNYYIWGVQLEAGAFPTSYIPTTASAATRPADSAVLDGTGIITGTYTMVEKPEGCAVINGTDIELQNGFTIERVMVFPATLTAGQITAIRAAM